MTRAEVKRLIHLLNEYAAVKFGDDEWWPGNAYGYLSDEDAAELADLLDKVDGPTTEAKQP